MIKYLDSTNIIFKLNNIPFNKDLIGKVNYTIPYNYSMGCIAYLLQRRCNNCNKFIKLDQQLYIAAQKCKHCGIKLYKG